MYFKFVKISSIVTLSQVLIYNLNYCYSNKLFITEKFITDNITMWYKEVTNVNNDNENIHYKLW